MKRFNIITPTSSETEPPAKDVCAAAESFTSQHGYAGYRNLSYLGATQPPKGVAAKGLTFHLFVADAVD